MHPPTLAPIVVVRPLLESPESLAVGCCFAALLNEISVLFNVQVCYLLTIHADALTL